MGTDVWLCPGDHGDVTSKRVSESETGRIGEVVAFDADATKGIVRMATGSVTDVRPITPSECRPCVVRRPGERALTHAVRMRAWAVARLLGAVEWGGDDAADEGSGSGAGRCSLPAELVDAIVGCLEVRPVSRVRVIALAASSIAANASIAHALDPSDSNWWISAPGSMPGGVGKESITFSLDAGTEMRIVTPVVIDRITMRIPPLPSGPLSVRVFHLEVFTGPHDLVGETWARAFTNPQMWARASRDFTSRDVGGDQAFAVYPPVEAAFVRVVCTRNAARARLSDDEYTELEGRWGDTLMLENIVPSSVGFFSVRFG